MAEKLENMLKIGLEGIKKTYRKLGEYKEYGILLRYFESYAKREKKKYIFSVIIPVYKTEEFLPETIDSVLTQTIGCRHTQIILVNDGSPDNSEAVCLEYQRRYPNNVVYIRQENSGVSVARNRGIEAADGLYLSFLDSDDKWDQNAFYQTLDYIKRMNCPDIVAAREFFFEARKGQHPKNEAIFTDDRMIDLEKEYWKVPISSQQCFLKYSILGDTRFLPGLKHDEDSRFMGELLLRTLSYGAMTKPIYWYRQREDHSSATDVLPYDIHYYTSVPTHYYDYLIKLSQSKYGKVLRFIQFSIMQNIGWRIRGYAIDKIQDEAFLAEYRKRMTGYLRLMDASVICEQKHLELHHILYIISLRNHISVSELIRSMRSNASGDVTCEAGGETISVTTLEEINDCRIEFYSIDEEAATLIIEGTLPEIRLPVEQIRLEIHCNDMSFDPELYPRAHDMWKTTFDDGDVDFYQIHFRVKVPLADKMMISAWFNLGTGKSEQAVQMKLKYGAYAHVGIGCRQTNYYIEGDRVLYSRDSVLHIEKVGENVRNTYESALLAELQESKAGRKWIPYRKYAIKHLKDRTALWLFSDQPSRAGGSAEVLFRYMQEHPADQIETAFILEADSSDFNRLSAYGTVIPLGSEEHLRAMLRAEKLISSSLAQTVIDPFEKERKYIKDLLHFDLIYVPSNTGLNDQSFWLNRQRKNIKLFFTASETEKQFVLHEPYGYTERQVIVSGLPKLDHLRARRHETTERSIYIVPAERPKLVSWLKRKTDTGHGILYGMNDLRESDYFKFYNGLLLNPGFHSVLEENDIQVFFAPDSGLESDLFYHDSRIHLIDWQEYEADGDWSDMKLLITDYSDVANIAAMMGKPVIYAQFDYNEFYPDTKRQDWKEYFSYQEDGFGPVVETVNELIDEITAAVGRSFTVTDVYQQRSETFFYEPPAGESRTEFVLKTITDEEK